MRKRFIAGNWKMYNGQKDTCEFFNKFNVLLKNDGQASAAIDEKAMEVVLFPPMLSIGAAVAGKDNAVSIGAQNCHFEKNGAFTGEVSAVMLREAKCCYVLIGHSERRNIFGEQDDMLSKKAIAALAEGLAPVFCVGELLEEREAGKTLEVIERQLRLGLGAIDAETAAQKVVIAYEPVWAIGTGKTTGSGDAQEVCAFIRKLLADKYGPDAASRIVIVYGGSVKPENTRELMSMTDVDGVLVGGASLKPESLFAIIKEAL